MESSRENKTMAETTQKTSDSSSDWENMLMSDFYFYSDKNLKNDQDSSIDVLDDGWLDSLQSALLNDDFPVFFSDILLTSNHTTSETTLMNQIDQLYDDLLLNETAETGQTAETQIFYAVETENFNQQNTKSAKRSRDDGNSHEDSKRLKMDFDCQSSGFVDTKLQSVNCISSQLEMPETMTSEQTIKQPEDDGIYKPERMRKSRDFNQNVIDGIAKQLNFSANVARMAKQYLDFVCASSTDKQRKGMSLELIAVVCFYIACNEKDGNDPRSIDQIRVVWKSNLLHSRQKVIYNNCYDLVCQLLGKSVDVFESTIKRFARKIGLSDAKCESALLLCSRAFKAFPAEMKVKEHKTVAAAALFEVAHICNLSEYSRKLGVSTWTRKQLTNLWSTKSGEILLDPLTDVSPAPTQLNVGIKRTILMNPDDADRDIDRLLSSSANKKRKISSSKFEYSVASTSAGPSSRASAALRPPTSVPKLNNTRTINDKCLSVGGGDGFLPIGVMGHHSSSGVVLLTNQDHQQSATATGTANPMILRDMPLI